jgi:hypothetical protein
MRKYITDAKARPNGFVAPIKITRSVGLQVNNPAQHVSVVQFHLSDRDSRVKSNKSIVSHHLPCRPRDEFVIAATQVVFAVRARIFNCFCYYATEKKTNFLEYNPMLILLVSEEKPSNFPTRFMVFSTMFLQFLVNVRFFFTLLSSFFQVMSDKKRSMAVAASPTPVTSPSARVAVAMQNGGRSANGADHHPPTAQAAVRSAMANMAANSRKMVTPQITNRTIPPITPNAQQQQQLQRKQV